MKIDAKLFQGFLFKNRITYYPNGWDILALLILCIFLALFAFVAKGISAPYQLGTLLPISLNPLYLPYYALHTVSRMLIAMIFSLLFTFIFGTLAAKNRHAERILIPFIDVMQSVPVLAFLSVTVSGFIALFPGSLLGPECAAIFAIFTAQVWNITLSFYQSLKTIPEDLKETSQVFHLSAWQEFWRIEVPFAMPGILWNMMLSMSASWFFVVASEAIFVANQQINLPGIGSYIAMAIKQSSVQGVEYAIVAMFLVILLYDQLLFRPLSYWAEKFKMETVGYEKLYRPWVVKLLQRTHVLKRLNRFFAWFEDSFVNLQSFHRFSPLLERSHSPLLGRFMIYIWYTLITLGLVVGLIFLVRFIIEYIHVSEISHVIFLGAITGLRVMVLIFLCSLIWVPIGVWIGQRPQLAQIVRPIAQFLAAFPAYLLFPVVVIAIVKYHLNVEIWTAPLMILGTQWYILFNVIVGVASLPKDFYQVADNFGLKGWQRWQRLILPGIFPYYITGAITAAGGAWNASIVAECVKWGSTTLEATGIGAYISEFTTVGDFPRVALGIAIMCTYVLLFNRLVWRPLYLFAQDRFALN
jgi:NitT/TauT family transport system permease protein